MKTYGMSKSILILYCHINAEKICRIMIVRVFDKMMLVSVDGVHHVRTELNALHKNALMFQDQPGLKLLAYFSLA